MIPYINLLIKPSSGLCNTDCTYCFYKDKKISHLHTNLMDIKVFKEAYKKATKEATQINIIFQGGEPLLTPIAFYKEVIKYTKTFNNKVSFSLQTNGLNITKEFAIFFKEHSFLIGLSLDGNEDTHMFYRSNFDEVLKGIELLNEYQVRYNILTVITDHLCKNIDLVLNFYKDKFKYLQFIPCLDKDNKVFLTNEHYITFLKKTFDFYYDMYQQGNPISIQFFDDIINKLLGYGGTVCTQQGSCSTQFVIEANGDVYSCDFYVDDNHKIGNIFESTYEEMFYTITNINFIKESKLHHNNCLDCEYYNLCLGGCKRLKRENLFIYCDVYKEFYRYALPKLNEIANELKNKML